MRLSNLNLPWSSANLPQTPFYYYQERSLTELYHSFESALKSHNSKVKLHLAIKANNNPDVLRFFKNKKCGVDIVSGGELLWALKTGFKTNDLIYSGVGKNAEELKLAVQKKIFLINIESAFELEMLEKICTALKIKANISFRVNPDVDAKTHPYIATGLYEHKFGLSFEEALKLYERAALCPWLSVKGIGIHIGSQLLDLSPLEEALNKTITLAQKLKNTNIPLQYLDVGGGLGISYEDPWCIPPFEKYAEILSQAEKRWIKLQGPKASLHSECGRALVGLAGWLITRVIGIKENPRKTFAVVDASMSELMRPALYQAVHPTFMLTEYPLPNIPTTTKNSKNPPPGLQPWSAPKESCKSFEIVGPVCESSDVLHPNALLPTDLKGGDILAIACAGAYGYTMSNFYNMRKLPAEYFDPENSAKVRLSRKAKDYR